MFIVGHLWVFYARSDIFLLANLACYVYGDVNLDFSRFFKQASFKTYLCVYCPKKLEIK